MKTEQVKPGVQAATLPPLLVLVKRNGIIEDGFSVPDPRTEIIREFNEQGAEFGLEAELPSPCQ